MGIPVDIFTLMGCMVMVMIAVPMIVPVIMDLAAGNPDWQIFVLTMFMSLAVGGMFVLANRGTGDALNLRQAFLLTTLNGFGPSFEFSQAGDRIMGILLGIFVFGEYPDEWTLAGSAIVVFMGIYTFYRERQKERKEGFERLSNRVGKTS